MMIKTVIPGTELNASSICLGTVLFGSTMSEEDSFRLMDAFAEQGGNFFDSALNYADWCSDVKAASEKTIGKWLKERKNRDRIIVSTKGACPMPEQFLRLEREHIRTDLHRSLKHLQTDCIDLYWLHRDDPSRPVEEIVDTLNEMAEEGKIRYFGCSNWTLPRLREAQAYARRSGKQAFSANQMRWSLAEQNAESSADETIVGMDEETKAFHANAGLAAVPFSSQAGGFFSGRYRPGEVPAGKEEIVRQYGSDANYAKLARVLEVAKETGKPPAVIALSYLLSQPFAVYPIIGSRTMEQLAESCEAGDFRLGSDKLSYIES
ncbi:aldo/keto reductase [Paenibacillus sp. MBLB4367]|uniref:aldo/keto reductase n=1 Tax=Paenibacillus sp. MBLB4367 TaxID=3384767 RepID=UPI003908274E